MVDLKEDPSQQLVNAGNLPQLLRIDSVLSELHLYVDKNKPRNSNYLLFPGGGLRDWASLEDRVHVICWGEGAKIDDIGDCAEMFYVLLDLGFDFYQEILSCLKVIAVFLHLGNVDFVDKNDKATNLKPTMRSQQQFWPCV